MQTMVRWTIRLLAVLLILLLIGATMLWLAFRASLPLLDGEIALPGLSAAVTIERDDLGIASIGADDRIDLARALGYLHAQERYFEMDLARRAAAGELSALLGAAVLDIDRKRRVHRFRARVLDWLPNLPDDERVQLTAYAEGVNAGLAALRARPWPYLLLRTQPEPWQPEDSLLIPLAMFFDLQDEENLRERRLDTAHRHLHPAAYAFIARPGTSWDAPVQGEPLPEPALPSVQELNLRDYPSVQPEPGDNGLRRPQPELPGSNNFAVAGALTEHGRALVANDMHLGLRVPNIWYRARLRYGRGDDAVAIDGFTLPGVPVIVVGSNGHIAWAFTNAYGDWLDLVRLQLDSDDGQRYRYGSSWQPFERIEERIAVAGRRDDEVLEVRETVWGPVISSDDDDAPLALVWTAHREGAVNSRLLELEHARDIDQALSIAASAGIPAQNFVVGDAGGRIGWTIAGRIPQRRPEHDPTRPVDGADLEGDLWLGWLDPGAYPRIADPESGRLWTANARVVGGEALDLIGDGGYDNGARARQIRDRLFAREQFDEAALLAIQLDDRAIFMEPWWHLLRDVLARAGEDESLTALAEATANWDGCACTDSSSYRLTRAFRSAVHEALMRGLAAPLLAHDEDYQWPRLGQSEGVVWQLLRERPAHLLPLPYQHWDELLAAQAQRVVSSLAGRSDGLDRRSWGEANTVRVRHPITRALPGFIARYIDMPAQALPGDSHMPRVQGVQFGASQRSVVAPGLESQAIAHMPGGQSGHPMSPYFGAGHANWAEGRPTPLQPGSPRWRLRLLPTASVDERTGR